MKNWLSAYWRKLLRLFGLPQPYKTLLVNEVPDRCDHETVYLVGEGGDLWFAAMRCPCGCGTAIQLSLLPDDKPQWSHKIHPDQSVSLHPSVWRKVGCKSHFWFKNGRVHWC